ncbi:MAG: hypothetical protein JWP57_61 [Spirosoma sp.]|nr:hypothetical protein [Spirosoma sp.]
MKYMTAPVTDVGPSPFIPCVSRPADTKTAKPELKQPISALPKVDKARTGTDSSTNFRWLSPVKSNSGNADTINGRSSEKTAYK